jgi:hypothetical protein
MFFKVKFFSYGKPRPHEFREQELDPNSVTLTGRNILSQIQTTIKKLTINFENAAVTVRKSP